MGCASSKEAEAERPVKQISGPVGVVKATPIIQAMHEAHTGQLAVRIVPDPTKHSPRSAKPSPTGAADHTKRIHTSQLRVLGVEHPSGVKKIRSAPLEILPTEEDSRGQKQGRSMTHPGGKVSFSTSPLAEKQHRRKAFTLEEPRKDKEGTGPVRLDVDAFLAGKWSGASLAVGRCNAVSFTNPLKNASASNQTFAETPLPSSNSPYSEPRRFGKDGGNLLKPPTPKSVTFVASWLAELHLAQYTSAFEATGYDEAETLTDLSNTDLAQIERFSGVTILPGHKKRLILASCRHSVNQPLALSKPASPHGLGLVRTSDSERPIPDAEVKLSISERDRFDRSRKLHLDGQTDVSSEMDGISSRATESANSSPASVLPVLTLPQSLAEARRGGHSIRGKPTPLTETLPNGQLRWADENRKPLTSTEGDSVPASAEGSGRRDLLRGRAAKHELSTGGVEMQKGGEPRRSKRSPRRSHLLKAAPTMGGREFEGGEMQGVLAPSKVEKDAAAGLQPVGRAAEQALRAQVQKKVEELQLIHAKDMQAPQKSPVART